MRRRWWYGLLSLLALILSGCGGVQSGQQAVCTAETFTPNYVPRLERLLHWSGFPVSVYFVRDANYTELRQSFALQGFDQWVERSEMKIRYRLVDSQERAQIVVHFDPTTRDGLTEYTFRTNGQLVSATISIGVKGNSAVDIRSVAAHEFGHALGIGGHSDNPEDMMYPTFISGIPLQITERDFNTLKTAYCNLFMEGDASRAIPPDETLLHFTIRCGE
ncbi:hypothetical protein HRbin15_00562 [bacterium HR15]|nr:hypothetical protein HRbin15_00562 [bacterium HR15]